MDLLSQLFEANRRESSERNMESNQSFPSSNPAPQSPQSVASSNPGSPVVSLFSARAHNRFPSSTSSLASSPGLGSLTEGYSVMKTPLTDVKEDPLERETSVVVGSPYFADFNQVHSDDGYPVVLKSYEYDLSEDVVEKPGSPKKRKSESNSTAYNFLRYRWPESPILLSMVVEMETLTKRWDTAAAVFGKNNDESLRSRANSCDVNVGEPGLSAPYPSAKVTIPPPQQERSLRSGSTRPVLHP
ncbi:conserved hypothetical protein [Histoplasma capsulatum H143]|uniref:Uncharacterized protein n=1 Tax=Ajellomyces capsulatus (strain H143) TaxID=544712 RepID=C6H8B1_AJECH|nr:conserved hypothetical protein [Histoplasma capsulatum H143]